MMRINKYVRGILLLSIIGFYAYTFMSKALDINDFRLNIAKTGLFVSDNLVVAVSYVALSFELTSIVLLVHKEKLGIYFSIWMMILFTSYIFLLNELGRYETCGCGGILNGMPFIWHFVINVSIIVVLIILKISYEEK
jgi:hypothetical protein